MAELEDQAVAADVPQINGFEAYHESDCGKHIYAFGGDVPVSERGTVERYIIEQDIWEPVEGLMPHSGVQSCAVLLGRYVWIIGGYSVDEDADGTKFLRDVYAYDFKENTWEARQPLQYGRAHMGVVAIESAIYVFGGRDETSVLNSTEMYDVLGEWQGGAAWVECPPMIQKRFDFGYYTHMNCIYAVGGYNEMAVVLQSIESFSPATLQWTAYAGSIGENRHAFGMGVANGYAHLIGGDEHDTVSQYVPEDPYLWEWIGPMQYPRKRAAVVKASGVFFVIGGMQDGALCHIVDSFDPNTFVWTELKGMTRPRSCPAVLVVNGEAWGLQ